MGTKLHYLLIHRVMDLISRVRNSVWCSLVLPLPCFTSVSFLQCVYLSFFLFPFSFSLLVAVWCFAVACGWFCFVPLTLLLLVSQLWLFIHIHMLLIGCDGWNRNQGVPFHFPVLSYHRGGNASKC